MSPDIIGEAIPGAVGALAGGGGVAWLTKLLLSRVITQYDRILGQHAKRLEGSTEKLAAAQTKIAVLESHLEDARRLRIDLEQRFAMLRGEMDAKVQGLHDEINDMRRDIFVAHERLRALAHGDCDISKIQAPPIIRKR